MTGDVLRTVYVGNLIGIMQILVLFFSNRGRMTSSSEMGKIFKIMVVALFACIADPIVYTIDGKNGFWITLFIYLGNSWLFLANMLAGRYWVDFLADHLNVALSKKKIMFMNSIVFLGCLILMLNPIFPFVFSVENNIYNRKPLFLLFICIGGYYMIESIIMYFRARKKGGILKFFPVQVFVIPVFIAMAVQGVFYGISVIWVGVTIAIAGTMTALKNEVIYLDKLTGIYNRSYLDNLQKGIIKKKNVYITGVMIDLNGFKSINDNYGHAEGDEALIATANLLRYTVGELGSTIRYAGDEFVILLNTTNQDLVEDTIHKIQEAFTNYNTTSRKPYKLSASMGYATLDLNHQTMSEFMNMIDRRMYADKEKYYEETKKKRRD